MRRGVRKATCSSTYKHGVCASPPLELSRVWTAFYELIKATLEAWQGEMTVGGNEDAGEAKSIKIQTEGGGITRREMSGVRAEQVCVASPTQTKAPHTHMHTCSCPVGADDYHYPGKYMWPREPATLSSLPSLLM